MRTRPGPDVATIPMHYEARESGEQSGDERLTSGVLLSSAILRCNPALTRSRSLVSFRAVVLAALRLGSAQDTRPFPTLSHTSGRYRARPASDNV